VDVINDVDQAFPGKIRERDNYQARGEAPTLDTYRDKFLPVPSITDSVGSWKDHP
jgi:hypothetical protein